LKEIAEQVGVSYPTIRSRLDKVIEALRGEIAKTQRVRGNVLDAVEPSKTNAENAARLMLSTATLTFDASNYDQPQQVTLNALPDADQVDNLVTVTATSPDVVTAFMAPVTIIDKDVLNLDVAPPSLTLEESSTTPGVDGHRCCEAGATTTSTSRTCRCVTRCSSPSPRPPIRRRNERCSSG